MFGKKDDDEEEYEEDEEYDDEEEEEESLSSSSVTNSLASKVPFLSNVLQKVSKDKDQIYDENSRVKKIGTVKKKKSIEIKPFHILILALLGVVLFVDLEEPEVTQAPVVKKPKKVDAPQEIVDTEKSVEAPTVETPKIEESVVKAQPVVETQSVIEEPTRNNDNSADMADFEKELDAMDIEEPVVETKTEIMEAPASVGQIIDTPKVDESFEDINTSINTDTTTDLTKKLLSDLEDKLKEEKKQQDQIEVLKPVSAPSYETIGSALVYNCSDKHWACIEKTSFDSCRQNYSWNKKNALPIECYPVANVGDNFECATIQQEKIDTVADTKFCNP